MNGFSSNFAIEPVFADDYLSVSITVNHNRSLRENLVAYLAMFANQDDWRDGTGWEKQRKSVPHVSRCRPPTSISLCFFISYALPLRKVAVLLLVLCHAHPFFSAGKESFGVGVEPPRRAPYILTGLFLDAIVFIALCYMKYIGE